MTIDDDDDDDDDVATVISQAKDLLPQHLHGQIGSGPKAPLPAAGRPAVAPTPPAPAYPQQPAPAPYAAPAAPYAAPPPAPYAQPAPAPYAQPAAPYYAPPPAQYAAPPAAYVPAVPDASRIAPTIALTREAQDAAATTGPVARRTPMGFLVYMTLCVAMTAAGVGVLVLFKLQGRWLAGPAIASARAACRGSPRARARPSTACSRRAPSRRSRRAVGTPRGKSTASPR